MLSKALCINPHLGKSLDNSKYSSYDWVINLMIDKSKQGQKAWGLVKIARTLTI